MDAVHGPAVTRLAHLRAKVRLTLNVLDRNDLPTESANQGLDGQTASCFPFRSKTKTSRLNSFTL